MPSRLPFAPAPQELVDKILASKVIDDNGCWNWPGATNQGYGRIQRGGRIRPKAYYVHRVIYGALVGPLEPPLVIDHLCRNTLCFNPEHLEAVTDGTNTIRGKHSALKETCANGHPWTPENRYEFRLRDGRLHRSCRLCHLEREARKRAKRRAA